MPQLKTTLAISTPQQLQRKDPTSIIHHNPKKWSNEEYKKFLEGLNKFYDLPINNKKIAKYMGPNYKPNHIRYIKGKYLRKLRKRSKKMQASMKKLLAADMLSTEFKELF